MGMPPMMDDAEPVVKTPLHYAEYDDGDDWDKEEELNRRERATLSPPQE